MFPNTEQSKKKHTIKTQFSFPEYAMKDHVSLPLFPKSNQIKQVNANASFHHFVSIFNSSHFFLCFDSS